MTIRLLVCGGRNWGRVKFPDRQSDIERAARERALLPVYLDRFVAVYGKPDIVIQGGAKGADAMARTWAKERGFLGKTFEANWSRGARAGRERNGLMLNAGRPTHVVGFPDDPPGPGTAHMLEIASARSSVMVINARTTVL